MENNINDKTLRILWISDIHFSEKVTKNKNFNAFKNSFLEIISNFHEVDYFLMSGDIADRGLEVEYTSFLKYFLKDTLELLKKKSPNIKLLVVPGNHDVQRDNNIFEDTDFNKSLLKYSDKNKYFKEDTHEKYFKNLFKNYSDHFRKSFYKKLFPSQLSTLKDNGFLFGHVIDLNKKTIFLLLNSAWYSIGNTPVVEIVNKHLSSIDFKGLTDDKKKDLNYYFSKLYNDYNSQVIGFHLIKLDKLKEDLEKYNDFLVLTIMHHPMEYLDWGELYNKISPSPFNESILKNTDVLLYGHEHIPSNHIPSFFNNKKRIPIPAGCFICGNDIIDNDNDTDNWFSILDFNIKKRTFTQSKYFWDNENLLFKEKNTTSKKKLKKKYHKTVFISRFTDLNNNIVFDIKSDWFVNLVLKSGFQSSDVKYIDNYLVYKENIYSFVNLNGSNSINIDFKVLKTIITSNCITNFKLVFFDIRHSLHKEYLDSNADRLAVIDKISKSNDLKFDEFRDNFFASLQTAEIPIFKNVSFRSETVPFWELESYIKF